MSGQTLKLDTLKFAGRDAISDVLDYDPTSGQFRWLVDLRNGKAKRGDVAGSLSTGGYIQIGVLGRTHTAQRLAWLLAYGHWPKDEIDHANGNRADNRLANLRQCSKTENAQNRSDQVAGTYQFRGRWRAMITVSGAKVYLGDFTTREAAMAAYRDAKRQYHAFAPTLRHSGI